MARKAKSATEDTAGINPGQSISTEERQRMIAEAAYFRAMQRGFNGGSSLDDWLAAEREINRLLPSPQQQKQERAAYDKLRAGVTKVLAEARDTVNAETLKHAFERATAELKKTGEYTAETVGKISTSLRKDMTSAAMKMGPKWEAFSEKSSDLFGVWRDRSNMFLAGAADAMADWLHQAGSKLEQQVYQSGEMVHSGTFECTGCGERVVLNTPAHLPPCAKCRKVDFRRV
ncbi:MAG: DUF2934 domain-containing protein [Gammaproteobacteria bacterium]|nr:DUF2934 domain-containing protein [Gammaproteobacteria bacterium]MDH3370031.1 DUF2934 domain-containing protein [Gammaproteobacteria bacterium]MDH3406652.1 DUF2934 domain-containing protein [Gammaproteobacteria bacterium]MDH3563081.1 DUF2934 domain-containing protein [Gammaproteobacteria bacterium]MDH5487250.1 DUF2934 domain-containing protein [Gammaproteobacteria bacterium]